MSTIVIGSVRSGAGKTSLAAGVALASGKPTGYIKPLGDRLIYQKKRLWDHDAAVLAGLLELEHNPEDITIGFEHAKLTYMYDEDSIRAKLRDMADTVGAARDRLIVEAGRDLQYGALVNLDATSVARSLQARLVLVLSGEAAAILDDITFVWRCVDLTGVTLAGVIANQVQDPEDFEAAFKGSIVRLGIPVLGIVPYEPALTHRSFRHIADALFAKVIAGEEHLDRVIKHILIGASSVGEAIDRELTRRASPLIITSGDRSDVIVAALRANAAGIILTNNFLPPTNIVAQASQKGTPMALVAEDTFQAAKKVDDLEPLLTASDTERIALLTELARTHVDLEAF